MADLDAESAKPWSLYVGTMVMAGMAVLSGIDAWIAAALGSNFTARMSLQIGISCGFAALGSLAYALRRSQKTTPSAPRGRQSAAP